MIAMIKKQCETVIWLIVILTIETAVTPAVTACN